jgi:hypothetical protein
MLQAVVSHHFTKNILIVYMNMIVCIYYTQTYIDVGVIIR